MEGRLLKPLWNPLSPEENLKHFASFTLDTANECLWRNGEQIALQPKPYSVLRYLVDNPGRLIKHDELLDALWPETYVQPQVLRTHMLELRKILGDSAEEPRFIQTLPKRGYCFIASVTQSSVPVAAQEISSACGDALEIREERVRCRNCMRDNFAHRQTVSHVRARSLEAEPDCLTFL
jgi:DNA-binding winged helix-turn-helix (wHTH) protein